MPILSSKIIELARIHHRITISDIINATQANRNTIKKYLERLVHEEYLIKYGKGRGVWYSLKN
jgi:predicted HTH transcriptional regulator